MLDTQQRSGVSLAQAFDELGGQPALRVSIEGAALSLQVRAEHGDAAVALLAETLREPRCDDHDLAGYRQELTEIVRLERVSPAAVGMHALEESLFGPEQQLSSQGSPEVLAKLTCADVRRFQQHSLGPGNTSVLLAGRVTLAEARTWVQRHLGSWQASVLPASSNPSGPSGMSRGIKVVPRPGLPQVQLLVGWPVPASGPDVDALRMAQAMYQDATTWDLSYQKGISHSNSILFVRHRYAGYMYLTADIQNDRIGEALRAALAWMGKVRSSKLLHDPLGLAKLRRAMVLFQNRTNETILSTCQEASREVLYGQSPDWNDHLEDRLAQVDAHTLEGVLQRYFDPRQAQVVLVGEPAVINPQVQGLVKTWPAGSI
jgi:predicted Zn-dependent peptidase